jgi:hypothetical protein
MGSDFDKVFADRQSEADEFYGLDSIYVYIRILSEVLFRLGRQYSTAPPGSS